MGGKNIFMVRNFSSRCSPGINTPCHGSFWKLYSSQ